LSCDRKRDRTEEDDPFSHPDSLLTREAT